MLEPLPSRNVARFMLPLADVMTVLFSLFLLLPHLENRPGRTASSTGPWNPQDQQQTEEELERLRRVTQLPPNQRVYLVTLTIAGARGQPGHLILREGLKTETIDSDDKAQTMVRRHKAAAAADDKELFYVLNPARGSDFDPTWLSRYKTWFEGNKAAYRVAY